MVYTLAELNERQDILRYNDYHSYWKDGIQNPDLDSASRRIMDVKAMKAVAIEYYVDMLNQHLLPEVALLYVPSSDRENIDTGVRRIAQRVATFQNRLDATACLIRHTTIPSAKKGGPRNIQVHLNSIRLERPELLYDRDILIIDDVTTSGSSLEACKQIVQNNAQARSIYMLALGRTI